MIGKKNSQRESQAAVHGIVVGKRVFYYLDSSFQCFPNQY